MLVCVRVCVCYNGSHVLLRDLRYRRAPRRIEFKLAKPITVACMQLHGTAQRELQCAVANVQGCPTFLKSLRQLRVKSSPMSYNSHFSFVAQNSPTLSLIVFTRRNFIADFLQVKCTFRRKTAILRC